MTRRIVREVMKSEVFTVSPETPMPDLQRRFASTKVGALPVVDGDLRLCGIVSRMDVMRRLSLEQSLAELADSDFDQTLGVEDDDDTVKQIGAAVGERLQRLHARDIMIEDVVTVAADASLREAALCMIERRIHRLPVVEDGKLIGIVSAFDFMRLYAEDEA